jgi:hypothetical protein
MTTLVSQQATSKPKPIACAHGRNFSGPELARRHRRHDAYLVAIRDAYERIRIAFQASREVLAERGELGSLRSLEILRDQIDLARPDLSLLAWLIKNFDEFDQGNGYGEPTPMPPDPFAYEDQLGYDPSAVDEPVIVGRPTA